jgi:regulator of RNase E activity RraB
MGATRALESERLFYVGEGRQPASLGPMSTDDPWDFYPCRVNDAPASIALAMRYQSEARPGELDTLYVAGVELEDAGEHGMGTAAEGEVLYGAEEEFTERLAPLGFVPVGRLRNKGEWQVSYFAASGKETEFHGMLALTLASTGRDVWTHIAPDPTWDYYDSFLVPDPERHQWMMDRRVVESLEESGDSLVAPRTVDHAARFPSRSSADAFAAAAEALGFTASDSDEEDSKCLVEVKREDPVSLAHIHGVVMELVDLAVAHGGDYDGWGCEVQAGEKQTS